MANHGPLVLFMTQGVSLATWDELGILDRELAVYRALAPHVGGVAIATYGDASERDYVSTDDGIQILPNRRRLPPRLYAQVLALAHGDTFRRARAMKTNQVLGGFAAMRAARRHRTPLVARAGFLWSEVADQDHGATSVRARSVALREGRLFRGAQAVAVTTERLKGTVAERHGVERDRIYVVPNYVETDRFKATDGAAREPGALLFAGRLAPEKNLSALLEALAGLDGVSLTLAGDGPQRAQLEREAADRGVDARFLGRVPHARLPELMASAEAFALPSLYEGHPKALIEAMACGLPVIGTDVQGIREVVDDGETGVLAGTGADELRAAVTRLLGDRELRERMGRRAAGVAQRYSLERIVELELEVLDAAGAAP